MPAFTCYKLKDIVAAAAPEDEDEDEFDRWVRLDRSRDESSGPIDRPTFRAKLYRRSDGPSTPRWSAFIDDGFGGQQWPSGVTSSAVVIIKTEDQGAFAFTFGSSGRFMLRPDGFQRAFGLRTALNLLTDASEAANEPALRGIRLSRMGTNTRRSEQQLARSAAIDEFELDRYRDIFSAATGRPQNAEMWGEQISGRDALHLSLELGFDDLGELCQNLRFAYERTDYQVHFKWVDYFQPVADPETSAELTRVVVDAFRSEVWEDLSLAPPEMMDWERFRGFHYHWARKQKNASYPLHRELRIQDYARGLDDLDRVTEPFLKTHDIDVRDGDDRLLGSWPVWRWLNGTFTLDGTTYVLDAGVFFAVEENYLAELNASLDEIPEVALQLPQARHGEKEEDYAARVVEAVEGCLLLDQKLVFRGDGERGVELCDVLTGSRRLLHLKRHFVSKGLSHLFAQATGAAELLVMDVQFRRKAAERIAELDDQGEFAFFSDAPLDSNSFEIVFGIIGLWEGRPLSKALPFLSRVNLRNAIQRLSLSNFRYSIAKVSVEDPAA